MITSGDYNNTTLDGDTCCLPERTQRLKLIDNRKHAGLLLFVCSLASLTVIYNTRVCVCVCVASGRLIEWNYLYRSIYKCIFRKSYIYIYI